MLQKTVTEYNYISNITVTEKVNITKADKIYQHKKGNRYDYRVTNKLQHYL